MAGAASIPFVYWATIVATTTVGTTMSDFADRSLGTASAVLVALMAVLIVAFEGRRRRHDQR